MRTGPSTEAGRPSLATHRAGCQGSWSVAGRSASAQGTDPARPTGDRQGRAAWGGEKSRRQMAASGASTRYWHRRESGVCPLMQAPRPSLQVSMADLCLAPQVANADR